MIYFALLTTLLQLQAKQPLIMEIQPGINSLADALGQSRSESAKQLVSHLRPRGVAFDKSRIHPAEISDSRKLLNVVFRKSVYSHKSICGVIGIRDEFGHELIRIEWKTKEDEITWCDVDSAIAIVAVRPLSQFVPIQGGQHMRDYLEDWITRNLGVRQPLPGRYKLFQTDIFYGQGQSKFHHGWLSFDDEIANTLISKKNYDLKWAVSLQFAVSKDRFILVVPIHWLTTGTAHAPAKRKRFKD